MYEELERICGSCPTQVIHRVILSCDRLVVKFLKENAPNQEELIRFFEDKYNCSNAVNKEVSKDSRVAGFIQN